MYVISLSTMGLGALTMFVPIDHSVIIGLLLILIGGRTFLEIRKLLGI